LKTKQREHPYEWGTVAHIDVYGNAQVLFIDIDDARCQPRIVPFLCKLKTIGIKPKWFAYSRSRHGWHVEIGIKASLTEAETVATQAVLGSDPARETMNLRRAISLRVHKHSPFWRKRWNILFLRKL
jgi:hypothetical protein